MSTDDARRVLEGRYTSMGMIRMDNSGYRKYWQAPHSIEDPITEDFVFRGVIPNGDVYVIYFDAQQRITGKDIIYVTEEAYQEEVRAHREVKLKEKSKY